MYDSPRLALDAARQSAQGVKHLILRYVQIARRKEDEVTTKEAAQCFRQAGAAVPADLDAPKLSKMRNVKKEIDGIVFDSTGESEAYRVMKLWDHAGIITKLKLQPRFVLQEKAKGRREIAYVADFRFFDVRLNRWRVVDYKGHQTAVFRIKLKLMAVSYPDVTVELWDRATVREYARAL